MRRRCSITSGAPPAMNTCAVAKPRGPFGSASTRRGVARLIRIQSSTAGGFSPAAAAIAGMCSRRFVEPPNAAWTSIAFSIAWLDEDLTDRDAEQDARRCSAAAERLASSSQTGSPDGASALCGSASPRPSATTCEVAAVPRNWHPPPDDPHARQPMVAA